MKVGFITIAGKPNAGKSTLLNAMVGEKVAIVSWRPQTTRNKITGIVNGDDYQLVFTDTPGLHNSRNKLGDYMMKSVSTALEGVDAILYVVNGDKGFDDFDKKFLDEHLDGKMPVVIALNKTDVVTKEKIFKQLEGLQQYDKIKAVVPVSAKKGENVNEVIKQLVALMPEGEKMYDDDVFTDKTMRFMASEIIREKALKLLEKEIPYGICVNINKFEMREDGSMYDIDADIVCEKDTHKPIIIGKKGEMLKKIATYARQDIEEMCGEQVYLTLWVRVKEDWRDSDYLLKNLGYDKKDI